MIINELLISDYLEEILGERPALRRVDPQQLKNVALFLKHGFSYYQSSLVGREVIFAIPIADLDLNPARIGLNINILSHAFNVPVVLVLDSIRSYQKKTYLQRRVPFMIPGKQLFIPQLLIDLKPTVDPATRVMPYFSPATQSMLIHHLHLHELDGMDQRSVASVIHYSEMSVSRAVAQLKQAEVLTVDKYGIHFLDNRRELWRKSLPFLRSPVIEILYASKIIDAPFLNYAGITALSHYSDIADDRRKTYAVSTESYKGLRASNLFNINHVFGEIEIQLWRYYPKFLTETKFVDPFSLYLSLMEVETDERTEAALESIINAQL